MIKLIATDIDGTISYKGKVHPEVIAALHKAQDQGIKLTLVTGRNARSIRRLLDKMALNYCDIPIIGQNGAEVFVMDANGKKHEVYNHFFKKSETDFLFKMAKKHRVQIFSYAYDENLAYVNSKWCPVIQLLKHTTGRKVQRYDFNHPLRSPISKIIATGSPSAIAQFRNQVSAEGFSVFAFSHRNLQRHNVEIVPKGVNKCEGLKYLASQLKLKPEEIAYFGDGENDLEAIKWAGWGVAMGNAHDHIKKVANFVAPSVQENGVAHEINRLLTQKN